MNQGACGTQSLPTRVHASVKAVTHTRVCILCLFHNLPDI